MTIINDSLYGKIEIPEEIVCFLNLPSVQRLRFISQSSMPSWLPPYNHAHSRLQHSLGVVHLADIATQYIEKNKLLGTQYDYKNYRKHLLLASLLHDVGTAPFAHLLEPILQAKFGKNCEAWIDVILSDEEKNLIKENFNYDLIVQMITGHCDVPHELRLIKNCIDLDNVDNIQRLNMMLGLSCVRYNAKTIITSLQFDQQHGWCMNEPAIVHLNNWKNQRKQLYSELYEPNYVVSISMLYNSFAYYEYFSNHGYFQSLGLTEDFFKTTDNEAFRWFLKSKSTGNSAEWSQNLLFSIEKRKLYIAAGVFESSYNAEWDAGIKFALGCEKELHLPFGTILIKTSKSKAERLITMPVITSKNIVLKWDSISDRNPPVRLFVFVHPEYIHKLQEVREYFSNISLKHVK